LQIIFDHINYVYNPGTAFERHAIKDINFTINKGEFIGLIGHTGSGKSTLIQHMNGLVKATSGHIYFNGEDIYEPKYSMKKLRSKVGLVFQYPEHQLFETTVFKDVMFGPTNLGLEKLVIEMRTYEALKMVGIGDDLLDASPFELSGGQKRRVAIAGVLAMKPEVLILDEPTAGLDPKGRDDILDQIALLHKESGITIILVTHSMEDVAKYADRLLVMNQGELVMSHTTKEVFSRYKELEDMQLAAPQVTYVMNALKEKGYAVPTDVTTIGEAQQEIVRLFGLTGKESTL
jgi:energy-coupling factor transport system ATP-binding protein